MRYFAVHRRGTSHFVTDLRLALLGCTCLLLSGCVGTIVATAADVAIEVAKVPFKAAGAVVDVAAGADDDDDDE